MTPHETPPPPSPDQPRSRHLTHAFRVMPAWKWKLLSISLVMGLLGAAGQMTSWVLRHNGSNPSISAPPAANTSGSTRAPLPGGSSGFVSDQPAAPSNDNPSAVPQQPANPTLTEKSTPWMTRIGLSLGVGLIVGVIFRTFLKIAAGFTALIGALLLALSYFHLFNIDFSSVRTEYASASQWLADQAYRLKDMVFHALPSSTSAAIGFFSGFKRR